MAWPIISQMWMTVLDRTNIIVTGMTACFVLYTRSAGVAYFSIGAVCCSLTVKVVKRVIQQPRPPPEAVLRRKAKKSYGMPSTHSATITFFATYILLAATYLPVHHSFPLNSTSRVVPVLITFPWAVMIVMSRVWLGHHTWAQVLAGSAYGVVFAFVWYALWTGGLNEYGKVVEKEFANRMFI